jgi:dephospho-CoA kinase
LIVGLTGGLGTGKSLVAKEFKRLGAHLVDCDEIARELTRPGTPAHGEIIHEFGSGFIKPDGTLDRKALAEEVFSDPKRLKRLNEITHPGIIREMNRRIEGLKKDHPKEIIVVDAPLLIEVGLEKEMDRVVVVYADEAQQIERIMKRDDISREEAQRRMGAQMPTNEKVDFADLVIDANGSVEEAVGAVEGIYERLKVLSKDSKEKNS